MLILNAATPAWGQHKCADPSGKVTYQQQPCSEKARSMPIRSTDSGSGGGSARTSLLAKPEIRDPDKTAVNPKAAGARRGPGGAECPTAEEFAKLERDIEKAKRPVPGMPDGIREMMLEGMQRTHKQVLTNCR
ncbi:MAG: hypothetical protein E6Q92_01665 [Burkholderiaceae bacterium]|nr:MAG: hypothetical protein E6Q92_01665 [Burkholderiaceae bacterium]